MPELKWEAAAAGLQITISNQAEALSVDEWPGSTLRANMAETLLIP